MTDAKDNILIRWEFDTTDNSIILLSKDTSYNMRKICLDNDTSMSDCAPVYMCTKCGIITIGKMLDKLNSQKEYLSQCTTHTRSDKCAGCKRREPVWRFLSSVMTTVGLTTPMESILKKISCPKVIIKLCMEIFPDEYVTCISIEDILDMIVHLKNYVDTKKEICQILTGLHAILVEYSEKTLVIRKLTPNPFTEWLLNNKNINDYTQDDLNDKDKNYMASDIVIRIIKYIGETKFPPDTCESIIKGLCKYTTLTAYPKQASYDLVERKMVKEKDLMYYMAKVIKKHLKIDITDAIPMQYTRAEYMDLLQ